MTSMNEPWDRFRIRSEVHRRGKTLTEIAEEAGLSENACRSALLGGSRKGAIALSDFLGVPLPVLFPGLYLRARSTRQQPTSKRPSESRQKNTVPVDEKRRRA